MSLKGNGHPASWFACGVAGVGTGVCRASGSGLNAPIANPAFGGGEVYADEEDLAPVGCKGEGVTPFADLVQSRLRSIISRENPVMYVTPFLVVRYI